MCLLEAGSYPGHLVYSARSIEHGLRSRCLGLTPAPPLMPCEALRGLLTLKLILFSPYKLEVSGVCLIKLWGGEYVMTCAKPQDIG